MKKPILTMVFATGLMATISGCSTTGPEYRAQMCPQCTDDQWQQINNPTADQKAAATRAINEQKQDSAAHNNRVIAQNRAQAELKAKRMRTCATKFKSLTDGMDSATKQSTLAQFCTQYVETGVY